MLRSTVPAIPYKQPVGIRILYCKVKNKAKCRGQTLYFLSIILAWQPCLAWHGQGTDKTRTVLSQLAETMRVPSAEYEAEVTHEEWPSSTDMHAPVVASQTRTVKS